MRQLWISVAILAGMVLLLSWNMVHVHQLTEPMREDLSQAVAAAREEDWQKAEALTQKAQEHWQSNVSYCTAEGGKRILMGSGSGRVHGNECPDLWQTGGNVWAGNNVRRKPFLM